MFDKFDFSQRDLMTLLDKEHEKFSECVENLEGTVRARTPEETIAKARRHFKAMGITRVAQVGGLDTIGMPVTICYRPNSRHLSSGQGKGRNLLLSEASAIMECVEGYHAEIPCNVLFEGSYDSLKNHYELVDPRIFSPGFFQHTAMDKYPFEWCVTTNILDGEEVYIPACLAVLDFSILCKESNLLCVSSNGLSSGNLISEAISHGILEVIERECTTKWDKLTTQERDNYCVDLNTITSPVAHELITQLQKASMEVNIWNVTDELAIPTFNCVIKDNDPLRSLGFYRGSGTHYVKDVALVRALTEAAQSRGIYVSGSRDDMYPDRFEIQLKNKQQHLSQDSSSGQKNSLDYRTIGSPPDFQSFKDTLHFLCGRVKEEGYKQIFVITRTRKEFNIPVVHVFIPGMSMQHDR